MPQIDGNDSFLAESSNESSFVYTSLHNMQTIPVHVSQSRPPVVRNEKRKRFIKTIQRNNSLIYACSLPTVINLNPRSLYNKTDEFHTIVSEYGADVICVSESWDRDSLPLKDIIKLENFKVITNVLDHIAES